MVSDSGEQLQRWGEEEDFLRRERKDVDKEMIDEYKVNATKAESFWFSFLDDDNTTTFSIFFLNKNIFNAFEMVALSVTCKA